MTDRIYIRLLAAVAFSLALSAEFQTSQASQTSSALRPLTPENARALQRLDAELTVIVQKLSDPAALVSDLEQDSVFRVVDSATQTKVLAEYQQLMTRVYEILRAQENLTGLNDPRTAEAQRVRGHLYFLMEKYVAAISRLEHAVKISEAAAPYYCGLALISLREVYENRRRPDDAAAMVARIESAIVLFEKSADASETQIATLRHYQKHGGLLTNLAGFDPVAGRPALTVSTSNETSVWSGDQIVAKLPANSQFPLFGRQGSWLKVPMSTGGFGWVQQSDVAVLRAGGTVATMPSTDPPAAIPLTVGGNGFVQVVADGNEFLISTLTGVSVRLPVRPVIEFNEQEKLTMIAGQVGATQLMFMINQKPGISDNAQQGAAEIVAGIPDVDRQTVRNSSRQLSGFDVAESSFVTTTNGVRHQGHVRVVVHESIGYVQLVKHPVTVATTSSAAVQPYLNSLSLPSGVSKPSSNSAIAMKGSPQRFTDPELSSEQQQLLQKVGQLDASATRFHREGKIAEAVGQVSEGLKIRRKVLGNEHPDTLLSLHSLGVLHQIAGDHEDAEPVLKEALRLRQKVLGPTHEQTADSQYQLAVLYSDAQKYQQAEPLYLNSLQLREKQFGVDSAKAIDIVASLARNYEAQQKFTEAEALFRRRLQYQEKTSQSEGFIVESLQELAQVSSDQRKMDQALLLYERALEIQERLAGKNGLETATVLNSLATVHQEQGRFRNATQLFERALQIRERQLGLNDLLTAQSLNNLATVLDDTADYQRAEELFRKALAILIELKGPEDALSLLYANNLATLLHKVGDFQEAERLHRQTLTIRERVLGPNHVDTAQSLNNLASILSAMGKTVEARQVSRRVLEIMERSHGPNHPLVARSLINLAGYNTDDGEFSTARVLLERAIEIQAAALPSNHPDRITGLGKMGSVLRAIGDLSTAQQFLQEALNLSESGLGPEHPATARALHNLAFILLDQKEYSAAERLLVRAVRIHEVVEGPEHPATATSLAVLAGLYADQADFDRSRLLYERSLKIRQDVLGSNHPDVAMCLNNLAILCVKQGNDVEAESLYQRALHIYEINVGSSNPQTQTTLMNLALLYERTGRSDSARNSLNQARRSIQTHVAHVLPALSTTEQQRYLRSEYQGGLFAALTLAMKHADSATFVQNSAEWLLNGKGIGHRAIAERSLLARNTGNPELNEASAKLIDIRMQLAALAMLTVHPAGQEARQKLLSELTSEEERLSRRLGAMLPVRGDQWVEVPQLRERLPAQTVFVDFIRLNPYDLTTDTWSADRYVAWVTGAASESETVIVDLGLADEIDELISRTRAGIETVGKLATTAVPEAEEKQYFTNAARLADRIWKPLEPQLNGAKTVILCPDGLLWLAPWAALPLNEHEFLIEEYQLSFVVSGRDLLPRRKVRRDGAAVILANPAFDQANENRQTPSKGQRRSIPSDDDRKHFAGADRRLLPPATPLPNTAIEAAAIQPNVESYTGQKATLYLEQFAQERVAKELMSPRVISFATHGFFLPDQKVSIDESVFSGQPESTRAMTSGSDGHPIENPLLRCGLLLAGCNNSDAAVGDNDGVLTGLEIVGIDLRDTELVVLSACETGIGDIRNGEGVAGLRQAFQLAGAEAVVSTLWQVPDRDSALLMSKFFEELAAGKSKSESLRNAQLERIEKRRERYGAAHPFYWAAFTLTGQ